MDDVESAILAAWFDRVLLHCRANPGELWRRLARSRGATLSRPPPWCVAIRANDTRLGTYPDAALRHPEFQDDVTIDADLLQAFCTRVRLEPSLTLKQAANRLGVTPRGLLPARVAGTLRQRYVEGLGGRWGHPHPLVSPATDDPLDPVARSFVPPDPAWSWTAAGTLASRLPRNFVPQTVTRVARFASKVAADRYRDVRGLHPEHPALDPPPPRARKSLALPDPPPDPMSAHHWKDGVHVGHDWRNPASRANYEQHQRALSRARLARKKRRMTKGPAPSERSQSKGSLAFRGYRWLCPRCGRKVILLYLPLRPVNLIESCYRGRGDYAVFRALIQNAGDAGRKWCVAVPRLVRLQGVS